MIMRSRFWVYAVTLVMFATTTARSALSTDNASTSSSSSSSVEEYSESGSESDALLKWATQLIPERDYNASYWRISFHSRSTQDFFFRYAQKLTEAFKLANAKVNFASIGTCDGINDPTIKYQFLRYSNWRAVFIEPMAFNVRDLVNFLADKNVLDRSFVLRAAATSECKAPTIVLERPMWEEKALATNKTIAHWMRRQIGSVLPENREKPRQGWTTEEVRCVTATDILTDWYLNVSASSSSGSTFGTGRGIRGSLLRANQGISKSKGDLKKLRPHILKIDVEGHDFEVLMSFMKEGTPACELPLLVEFEAKSIADKFPLAKRLMEAKGYVVSDFAQDGFALLKADRILDSVHPTDKVAGSKSVEGEGRRRDPQRRRRNKSKKLRERGDSEMLR